LFRAECKFDGKSILLQRWRFGGVNRRIAIDAWELGQGSSGDLRHPVALKMASSRCVRTSEQLILKPSEVTIRLFSSTDRSYAQTSSSRGATAITYSLRTESSLPLSLGNSATTDESGPRMLIRTPFFLTCHVPKGPFLIPDLSAHTP
jgi:hypothetical protein